MAIEVKWRETWRRDDEVSYEVVAFLDEEQMFAPGATVTRDLHFGESSPRVSVSWASASNNKTIENAEAQLAVMRTAVVLAKQLEAGVL